MSKRCWSPSTPENKDGRMNFNTVFGNVNDKLRSAVKRVGMGGYINSLSASGPLRHEMNCAGDKIAFINARIFDGICPEIKENMTILVVGDKIMDVCQKDRGAIPENFFIINAAGQTIMPGFIDSHIHICSPFTYDVNISAVRQMRKQIALNNMKTIYSGVTTVCDMGGPQGIIKEFQKLSDRNEIPGPRYSNSYTLISPIKDKKLGYPTQVKPIDPFQEWLLEGQVATRPKTIKELQKACCKVKEDGGTHIKTTYQAYPFSSKKHANPNEYPVFEDEWMRTILRTGKELGLAVSIHSPFGGDAEKCVDLAIEVGSNIRIQHMTFDIDLSDSIIQKMQDYGFYIIPTVMVYGDSFQMPKFVSWLNKNPETHMTPEANRQIKTRIQNVIDQELYSGIDILELDSVYFREQFDFVRRNTLKAHEAGIIGFGTDIGGTYTGFFGRIFSEIMHYADFGISVIDILKYLTSVNAKINGLADRGVIQPGKLADLIAINGNPLKDSSVLNNVYTVMKGGVFVKYEGIEYTLP
jgi:imidazolonepropionase-like amidohydrolase